MSIDVSIDVQALRTLADNYEGDHDAATIAGDAGILARGLLALLADRERTLVLLEKGHAVFVSILAAFKSIGIVAPNGRTAAEDICALGAEITRLTEVVKRREALGERHAIVLDDVPDTARPVTPADADIPATSVTCWCEDCEDAAWAGLSPLKRMMNRRFILCPTCGNKRCPRAKSHTNPCTDSNDPGQPGSSYP